MMMTGPFATISIMGCIWLLMTNESLPCILKGHWAYCSSRSLVQVPSLPADITHLDLSLNLIRQLNEDSFKGLENLVHLDLGWQRRSPLLIKNNAFRGLQNLSFLHLGKNRYFRLETGAFLGLSNLKELVLLSCDLDENILMGRYLEPLTSLQSLNLYGNKIKHLRPAMFFKNMTALTVLSLSLNRINSICETDLLAFQSKHFDYLNLDTVHLSDMNEWGFNWTNCGNPFRDMSFQTLDLSNNGINTGKAELLFSSMQGTKINHLIISMNTMGSGFGFSNSRDPDSSTFDSLKFSDIKVLDVYSNFIHTLKRAVFRSLLSLEDLSLAKNEINKFQIDAFLGLSNLVKLNLSYNLIGEIYSDTFENLPNLLVLDLTNNHIGIIQYESFSGLSNLIALDLTGNSLSLVRSIAPLPNLKVVHLDDNKIIQIYRLETWANNAVGIRLNNNRLQNLEDLYVILTRFPNIYELNLGRNFFSQCVLNSNYSVPINNTLHTLYLHNNALELIWKRGLCLNLFNPLTNLASLYLQSNQLEVLPDGIFRGLLSLRELDLSHNSLTHLRKGVFPSSLQVVDLSFNFLSSPDPDIFHLITTVFLYNNSFYCDCNLAEFKTWANETSTVVPGLSQLHCRFPEEHRGRPLSNFTLDACEEDDENQMQVLRLALFVSTTSIIAAVILVAIVYARFRGFAFIVYRRLKSRVVDGGTRAQAAEGQPVDNFQYDVYICFPESDFVWVESALLSRLDSQLGEGNELRCCFEARDFLPGEDHLTNIRSAIWGSRKTLCVVSKAFLKDGWCLEAFMLAQGRVLEELKDVLVVVVVGNIPYFRLMKYEPIRNFLKNREYLKWPEDGQDMEWFFDRLHGKIFKEVKLKEPREPVEQQDGIELQAVRQLKG